MICSRLHSNCTMASCQYCFVSLLKQKRKKCHKHVENPANIPCILGYQSLVAPILRPFHHPNRQVSWHQDQLYVLAYPSLLVCCHQGHQSSPCHPNPLVSWLLDPRERQQTFFLRFVSLNMFVFLTKSTCDDELEFQVFSNVKFIGWRRCGNALYNVALYSHEMNSASSGVLSMNS